MVLRLFSLVVIFLLAMSCGSDDDLQENQGVNSFYSNTFKSASETDLYGIWAIFNVEYQGVVADVPLNYQECGRDFFIFSENKTYTEYVFESSGCDYFFNVLNWELENGIINLSNNFNQNDELVVTKLDKNQLVFKSRFDIDEDGELDVITIYAKPYKPNEIDVISNTFNRNNEPGFENLISYNWDAYAGFNEFDRYEIYRSEGDNCSKGNATLIKTITEVNETEFTDLNPSKSAKRLCYFLKVYTNKGLLGESYLNDFTTEYIRPSPVNLYEPTVNANQISFNWNKSEDPYFSHYELAFSNYGGGTGSSQQEYTVAILNDIEATSFVDENPPYLENPFYVLYVHNIFGNKTSFVNYDVTTFWEVNYKRQEIIDIKAIESYVIDSNEPMVYFYGKERGQETIYNIHRFNYETKQTEAVSNYTPNFSTGIPIKTLSTNYGKELFIEQASELYVYDAATLEYKYALKPNILGVHDFIYTNNGYWLFITNNEVYTFTRDNANLTLVDSKPHFTNHQGSFYYKCFGLNNNKIIVGHNNEVNSYVFDIDVNGVLSFNQIVPIPILNNWESKSEYNAAGQYIINFKENRLYSTSSFALLESFEEPYFSSGLSIDGTTIFGTNNDPNWQVNSESIHKKEALQFNRNTQLVTKTPTIGYPLVVFENYKGDVMGISSGLKKERLTDNINDKADIFIERIK
ncbi:lipocalin family protein [Algibacter pectinivorans]|uniref:Lipocalin-like domain-containing protein n=1 Tax=Algibacter pectinivorans TaxID=870482 RepID=A0A1I1RJY0_9FLAO|nr:lipocalin family protein [Algibacter pectinivorans]SFD34645.1 Lipocalin-like domain-containing protein [Algibacter pectinivorans]